MTNHPQKHNNKDSNSNDHQHQHHHEIKKSPKNIYAVPFLLILAFGFIEAFGGVWTNSLALLSDAWHMLSDSFALGLAWFAAHLSAKPGSHKHTSGQSHIEFAASVINTLFMLVVVAYIIVKALLRFDNPQPVTGGYVMVIAFAGLLVNLIVAKMLHGNHAHNHAQDYSQRAAYLHVLGDLLGSVAAIIAGAVIYFNGWQPIDPLLSIFISLLLLYVTIKLIIDIWQSYKNG